eukprot:bmy_14899T0
MRALLPLPLLLACAAHAVGALPRLCTVLQVLREERDQCLQGLAEERARHPAPGSIFRNCTQGGWSETFPRPDLACGVHVNDSSNEKRYEYLLKLKVMYTVGYSSSLVMLLLALSILCAFRKLHCTRNYIHMHLFVSFILRALSNFIKDAVLFSDDDVAHCDAHRVPQPFLLLRGLSPDTFWKMLGKLVDGGRCWDINANASIWWVIRGPVIVSVLRPLAEPVGLDKNKKDTWGGGAHWGSPSPEVMCTVSEECQGCRARRLAKSTLLLVPLFGVHYIVFAFSPEDAMEMQLFFELALGSFQGLVVAVLYCFLNGEVQLEVQKKWRQWHLRECPLHPAALGSFSSGTKASPSAQSRGACRTSVI